jgi:L-asparaginase/Glu-tRNA(Gln) amidotransferase subunit D
LSIDIDVTTPLPRVAVMTTGGTIDSVGADRLDLAWYFETRRQLASGDRECRHRRGTTDTREG